jgi:hypothetical protein
VVHDFSPRDPWLPGPYSGVTKIVNNILFLLFLKEINDDK